MDISGKEPTTEKVLFLDLDDIELASTPSCSVYIQLPTITVERLDESFRISARFNLITNIKQSSHEAEDDGRARFMSEVILQCEMNTTENFQARPQDSGDDTTFAVTEAATTTQNVQGGYGNYGPTAMVNLTNGGTKTTQYRIQGWTLSVSPRRVLVTIPQHPPKPTGSWAISVDQEIPLQKEEQKSGKLVKKSWLEKLRQSKKHEVLVNEWKWSATHMTTNQLTPRQTGSVSRSIRATREVPVGVFAKLLSDENSNAELKEHGEGSEAVEFDPTEVTAAVKAALTFSFRVECYVKELGSGLRRFFFTHFHRTWNSGKALPVFERRFVLAPNSEKKFLDHIPKSSTFSVESLEEELESGWKDHTRDKRMSLLSNHSNSARMNFTNGGAPSGGLGGGGGGGEQDHNRRLSRYVYSYNAA